MEIERVIEGMPRLRLCQLPTPIQRLTRLEVELGLDGRVELYVKRDDLTGLALGGNKGRKLEFSLADAQARGADTILTCGAVQSNHCRQTAVAGITLGFEVHLFLRGERPASLTGNLVPSALCGAEFHFVPPDDPTPLEERMEAFAEELRARGRRPYLIPSGASDAVGAVGYVLAARELARQQRELGLEFDWIVTATGSGGTQAGLLAGARLFELKARILGISVVPPGATEVLHRKVADLAGRLLERLEIPAPVPTDEVLLTADYAGSAYGEKTAGCEEAQRLFARLEGLFLDPTYTAKSAAGFVDYARRGRFRPGERALFIHTGGTVAIFARG